jgi:hypothetical protein
MVLYGGVSLCSYMHGNTKETNRLVRASALLAAGASPGTTPTEIVYRKLLKSLAKRDGFPHRRQRRRDRGLRRRHQRRLPGQGPRHNLSQDALRDLWLERGAIKEPAYHLLPCPTAECCTRSC